MARALLGKPRRPTAFTPRHLRLVQGSRSLFSPVPVRCTCNRKEHGNVIAVSAPCTCNTSLSLSLSLLRFVSFSPLTRNIYEVTREEGKYSRRFNEIEEGPRYLNFPPSLPTSLFRDVFVTLFSPREIILIGRELTNTAVIAVFMHRGGGRGTVGASWPREKYDKKTRV